MLALLASAALTADVWPSIAGSVAPHEQNLPLVEMQRAPTARPATSLLNSRRPPLNLRGGAARVTKSSVAAASAYLAVGGGFAYLLTLTMIAQPMFPLQPDSVEWCRSWLATTVADYYGAALVVCGVIFASERPPVAVGWSLGCLLLGTPACCAWTISRLLRYGTLRLVGGGKE